MAFTPRIELAPVVEPPDAAGELGLPPPDGNPHVTATTRTEAGPVYRVGRIRFLGHHAVRDSTLRKALVLQEGDLFDAGRVRRSLARLNRLAPLQRVDPAGVLVEPIAERGLVNLTIPVKERPRGFWSLSGPLGPLSVFGPLSYTIGSRLPAAGQGPLELSTYYMTFSLLAWPLGSIFPALSRVGAVFALQRPQLPGQWWSSGILLAPQLGWRGAAAGYGVSHLTEAARTAMRADALPPPSLSIPVAWHPEHSSDGAQPVPIGFLQCAEPKPRWAWLRTAAATLMDSAMSWLLTSKLL